MKKFSLKNYMVIISFLFIIASLFLEVAGGWLAAPHIYGYRLLESFLGIPYILVFIVFILELLRKSMKWLTMVASMSGIVLVAFFTLSGAVWTNLRMGFYAYIIGFVMLFITCFISRKN